jgi:signal transduction histidine kinase
MTSPDVELVRAVSEAGLRFFGVMSASVSHEIRNKLAVINEKAGLVEDIAVAMRSGRAPDPDRLEMQAQRIVDQIRQANRIVRALNRLAHSTDEADATVDVAELVALVVELYGRKAAMAQMVIEAEAPTGEIEVRTNPFLLANAIGLCLDSAMANAGGSRALRVIAEGDGDGVSIRIRGLEGDVDSGGGPATDRAGLGSLLETLGSDLAVDRESGDLVLSIRNLKPRENGSQP